MGYDDSVLETLPPEKLLNTTAPDVIKPALRMMGQVETLELYLDHERQSKNRPGIVRYISDRISELQEQDGQRPLDEEGQSETTEEATGSRLGEPAGTDLDKVLLEAIHALSPDGSNCRVGPPEWDNC
jgi:hypothetical protein